MSRRELRRLIAQVSIALHLTPDQVRSMDLEDFQLILQELPGRRVMSDDEIGATLNRWLPNLSRSNSVRTRQS